MYARNYGMKVDVWAMGVIVYGLIEGRFPFKDGHAILTQDPKYPENMQADFEDFLKSMLAKKESKRSNADAFVNHRWLKQQPMQSSSAPCFTSPRGKTVHFNDSPKRSTETSRKLPFDAATSQLPSDWMNAAGPLQMHGVVGAASQMENQIQFSPMVRYGYPTRSIANQNVTLLTGPRAVTLGKYSAMVPQMSKVAVEQR